MCKNNIQNECNAHHKWYRNQQGNNNNTTDNIRCANGNKIRIFQNKHKDNEQKNVLVENNHHQESAMPRQKQHTQQNNRSHWCLNHNRNQTSLNNNVPIYSIKFAFHRIVLIVGLALFTLNARYCATATPDGQQQRPNAKHSDIFSIYKSHHVIQPAIYDATNQRHRLQSTRQTNGEHAPHIILEYKHLDDQHIVADLFLNTHLLTDNHFLRSQNVNGSPTIQTFNRSDANLCQYQGRIRSNKESRIALSTCNGINGVVYDGNETYFIVPNEVDGLHKTHYLVSQSQIDTEHPLVRNSVYGHPNELFGKEHKKFKRSVADALVREPYNANKQSSFVELVIVIDNDIYKEMNENLDKVHKYCKDIANIINSLYVPLNIFIALVGVVVWTEKNEIELTNDGDKTLKNFLNYRRKVLIKDHPNDNAQLLTKEQFDGGVVGKALKGPICTFEFSGGVSTDHSPLVTVVATTIAHEMGHNFGMEHDSPDCKCADERCIMSASSSSIAPTHWSECSIDQLNLAIHQGMNHCLRNVPDKLFEPPTCGNGFVEAGEECDCGLASVCKNTCCEPETCKLRSNATCATGKCCDLTTCQPHAAGFECRSAIGECDLPEYCNGEGEWCPVDYFKRDTESCANGKAFCYNGSCKSRDDQCKVLWGPSGKSSELCYEKNLEGSRHGNCGYDRVSNVYKNCSKDNIYCGMLQCRHLNERLEFGMESVAVLSHSFISHDGSIIPCRTAVIDLGLETMDPGLAPDGSKCGEGKMCVNQACVTVEKLQSAGKIQNCENNCNGHGICDNIGHCHCDKGFAPPNCDSPGPGGSLHSGPATDPNDGYGIARILYVFFLGVVPFISLSLFLLYYWRQNRPWFISQTAGNDLKIMMRPNIDRSAPPPPPSSGTAPLTQLSPSSTDDMNATLLKSNEANEDHIKRELFGNFKGFSLKPLPMSKPNIVGAANVAFVHPVAKKVDSNDANKGDHCVPTRSAPLPPPSNSPKKQQQTSTAPKMSFSSFRYQNINTTKTSPETPIEVKLFASKPADGKERPKISNPVLENSTHDLTRIHQQQQANSLQSLTIKEKPLNDTVKPSDSPKKIAIDKKSLKNLEISAPIKQVNFSRSQSMRSPSSENAPPKRPVLASASMRHPGMKRPTSIVDRPKCAPPPRPNPPSANGESFPGEYDDCETAVNTNPSLSNSTDNIYCVIEEVKSPSPPNGLLSEIVNEIENRNASSIYSTSKKNQRKNPAAENAAEEETYQNLPSQKNKKFDTCAASSSNAHDNIYMNTSAIDQIKETNGTKAPPKSQNTLSNNKATGSPVMSTVSAMSQKYNATKPKPVIASKPSIFESKTVKATTGTAATAKESSQSVDATKKTFPIKSNSSNAPPKLSSFKATINPTSNVRSLHKRFENQNA